LFGDVMAKMRRKADLPTKTCLTCARPFAWRKKWARDWDNVKYCSQRCRDQSSKPSTMSESDHG
jgi:hypothetical protein